MPLVTSLTTQFTSPQYQGLFEDPLGVTLITEVKTRITDVPDTRVTDTGDIRVGDYEV